jgi:flagellar biosynthesis protein FlhF
MRIQRYFAADMRQALRKVRDAQGPEAVILSSRKLEGGVEVVSAVDYDEADLLRPAAPAGTPDRRGSSRPAAARQAGAQGDADRPDRDPKVTGETDLNAVREELHSIRSLLERQLSGLAWGELGRRQPHRAALLRRLAGMELDPRVVREVVAEVPATTQLELAWRHALAILSHRIDAGDDDLLDRGGVVALVGSTGVGKTTTVAKLAARFALRHGADQVALLTTDSFRVGAVEQLRTYARLMGVPVRVAGGREELRAALDDVSGRRLVLIDTAGMSQRDIRLSEQLALIRDGAPVVRAYCVLSAAAQRPALEEVVSAFRGAPLEGCILTKLDEATSLGGALSVVAAHRLKVAYVSDGQRVPEDLRPARAHQLVSRAVGSIPRRNPAYDDESLELTYGALSAAGQL